MPKSQQFPIFVISLKESAERRAFMTKQLKEMGLSFTFFDAIDCRQGIPDQYKDRCDQESAHKKLRRPMLNGEWGCALSHALLYEKIIAEQIEHTIILEDDAVLTADFKKFVTTDHLKQAKKGLVLLRIQPKLHLLPTFRWLRPQPVFDNYYLYRMARRLYSAYAYYLTLNMAHKLHKATQTISYVADWPIDTRLHAQLLDPFIADHHGSQFESNIMADEGRRVALIQEIASLPHPNRLYRIIQRLPFYRWLRPILSRLLFYRILK